MPQKRHMGRAASREKPFSLLDDVCYLRKGECYEVEKIHNKDNNGCGGYYYQYIV